MKTTFNLNRHIAPRFRFVLILFWVVALEAPFGLCQTNTFLEEYAQEYNLGDIDESVLDNYLQQLEHYTSKPLDINKLGVNDLKAFLFLSDKQIQSFITYRKRYGPFISHYELQAVPHFDLETIQLLLPFLSEETRNHKIDQLVSQKYFPKHYIQTTYQRVLPRSSGYKSTDSQPPNFAGDPNSLFIRYRGSTENGLSWQFNLEKDAGESFGGPKDILGFDKMGFSLSAKEIGRFQNIVVGDYHLNLGQGLIYYSGFNTRKGGPVEKVAKREAAVNPYGARSEDNFLRGIAMNLLISDKVSTTPFVSFRKRDANLVKLDSDTGVVSQTFSSIKQGGLHRTMAEIEDERSLSHGIYGLRTTYAHQNLRLSLNALRHQFSHRFAPQNREDNIYRHRADNLNNLSLDFKWVSDKWYSFGEYALSDSAAGAGLLGIQFVPSTRFDITVLYRNFSERFNQFGGQAFSENSEPRNERGLYISGRYQFSKNWTLSAFVDRYSFPWQRFRVPGPSDGSEFMIRLDYVRRKKMNIYVLLRRESKDVRIRPEGQKFSRIDKSVLTRVRLHGSSSLNDSWQLRSRMEYRSYGEPGFESDGFLILQDVFYRPPESPFQFNARLSYFDIDDFDSRIYTYENNLSYLTSIPFFYGQGLRSYLNLRIRRGNLKWELRYSTTWYLDDFEIGSGPTSIEGSTVGELSTQIIYQF